MITYIDDISTQMGDISASSADQAGGVSEVNAAAIDLDRATQENAAMYEETSEAVTSLREISEQLEEMMVGFRTSAHAELGTGGWDLAEDGGRSASAA